MRKQSDLDFHKFFDGIVLKPYSLVTILVALSIDQHGNTLNTAEQKELITKAHFDIQEFDYARFKYSSEYQFFTMKLEQFEALGPQELKTSTDLKNIFSTYDNSFAQHQYLSS